MIRRVSWNDEEIARLKYLFIDKDLSIEDVSLELGRSVSSVKYMLNRKKINKGNIKFNDTITERILKEVLNYRDDNEISEIINKEFDLKSTHKDIMNYLQREYGTSSKRRLLKKFSGGK
jgi:hypothetical protein